MRGREIYIILITGTVLITLIMLLIDYRQQLYERDQLQYKVINRQLKPGENIDELLLSANDLSIAEKKAFINIYLKTPGKPEDNKPAYTKNKLDELYRSILQRKINRSTSKPREDFSVKPVPK
jgi:hypothetical protein